MESRYCTRCGSPLEEKGAFCVRCGASVTDAAPPSPQSAAPGGPAPAPAGTPAGIGGNRGLVVAIIVGALIIAAAILIAVVRPWYPQQPQAATVPAASSSSADSQPSSESAGPDASSDAVSGQSGSSSGSAGASIGAFDRKASVDCNDGATLHAVNLFLSNFTEAGALMNGYTFDGASDLMVADFSAAHIYLNSPDSVHEGLGPDTWEVEQGLFYRNPVVFLKRGLPDISASGAPVGPYGSFEAHVNLDPGRVPTSPQGVAYATSSKDAGDGRTQVTFDIYYGGPYDALDEALYAGTVDQLKAHLGVSSPVATGVAVIEPYDDGTIAPFKLWSYTSTR